MLWKGLSQSRLPLLILSLFYNPTDRGRDERSGHQQFVEPRQEEPDRRCHPLQRTQLSLAFGLHVEDLRRQFDDE